MGIGFVLLLWVVALCILGTPVAGLLLWVGYRTGGRWRCVRLARWLVLTGLGGGLYGFAVFLGYACWCSETRGVDPGIGDSWHVPVGYGYMMSMIDVPDVAYLHPGGDSDWQPVVDGITDIGEDGSHVFGFTARDGAFVFDTTSGTLHRHKDERALLTHLQALGIDHRAVAPVCCFYAAKRWCWLDLAAPVVAGMPLAVLGLCTLRRAWKG